MDTHYFKVTIKTVNVFGSLLREHVIEMDVFEFDEEENEVSGISMTSQLNSLALEDAVMSGEPIAYVGAATWEIVEVEKISY